MSVNAVGELRKHKEIGEFVCWSRMQAEAGQSLSSIVSRKETERVASGGVFFWGVGNPPATITSALARSKTPVSAVFSVMKSKPKMVDVEPTRTVVWRSYIDMYGVVKPLPRSALVTSRGDSAKGPKSRHNALICRSDHRLSVQHEVPFDPSAYRNAGGNRAPVGPSQVTALLEKVASDTENADYEVNLSAFLTDSYWVRLLDPLELQSDKVSLLNSIEGCNPNEWHEAVEYIRSGPSMLRGAQAQGALL